MVPCAVDMLVVAELKFAVSVMEIVRLEGLKTDDARRPLRMRGWNCNSTSPSACCGSTGETSDAPM